MAPHASTRKRALATIGTSVGSTRQHLYHQAYAQINSALKQEFYLEAITLIESLISDRLESRISFLKKFDFSFKTLGTLIKESRKIEKDVTFKNLVSQDLDTWRENRNKALHEMVKLADGETTTWSTRVEVLVPIATDGLKLLRRIDKRFKELRKVIP